MQPITKLLFGQGVILHPAGKGMMENGLPNRIGLVTNMGAETHDGVPPSIKKPFPRRKRQTYRITFEHALESPLPYAGMIQIRFEGFGSVGRHLSPSGLPQWV